jgi:hypothetical protein
MTMTTSSVALLILLLHKSPPLLPWQGHLAELWEALTMVLASPAVMMPSASQVLGVGAHLSDNRRCMVHPVHAMLVHPQCVQEDTVCSDSGLPLYRISVKENDDATREVGSPANLTV